MRSRQTSAQPSPFRRRVGASELDGQCYHPPPSFKPSTDHQDNLDQEHLDHDHPDQFPPDHRQSYVRFRDIFDDYVIGMKEAVEEEEAAAAGKDGPK